MKLRNFFLIEILLLTYKRDSISLHETAVNSSFVTNSNDDTFIHPIYSMKSTAFLTTIMTLNWIFEIISFYTDASSMLFDIINALQGVFIFVMFVCTPRIFQHIMRWWKDRGSFRVLTTNDIEDIQMTTLKQNNNR